MSDAVWPSKEDRDQLMADLFMLLFEHMPALVSRVADF
jgi:hypothetical protein